MDTLEQVILSNAVVATALALLATIVGLTCRRAALVHSLWIIVLIKLITPPIWQVEIFRLSKAIPREQDRVVSSLSDLDTPNVHIADHSGCPREEEGPPVSRASGFEQTALDSLRSAPVIPDNAPILDQDSATVENSPATIIWTWSSVKPLLWSVWLAGTMGWMLVAAFRVIRFQLMLRFAQVAPTELQDRVQLLAECLELIRPPHVLMVPGAVSPMIWPIGLRPRLLLPQGLLDRLTLEQGDTLLTHELAHLRRRDHWVRALELLVTGLYWWHPVVWWARQAIREAEEECCDAWVMWVLPASSRAYASALVEALDFLAGARPALLPPAACGLGQFQTLKRRLTMILTGTTPRALSRLGFLAVLGLAFLLPVVPTWGQSDRDDEKKTEKDTISKDLIKKITKDALKGIDVQGIKKEVQDALDKVNVETDLGGLGDLKIDLNLDLDGLMDNLSVLGDVKDGSGRKDLSRAKAEIQRAMAQVERAKAQFDRAQAVLKKAQAKLVDLEAAAKASGDKADMILEKPKKEKFSDDLADQIKKSMELKKSMIEKAKKDKAEKMKDFVNKKPTAGKSKDDDLEKRLDQLMKEVQDLSRDIKKRRSADKDEDDDEEGN
jgi:beta-lactamase regulating signal transducer with metallopeptidase domain